MLIKLNPGLKCKQCDKRMTMAIDRPGSVNLVLIEDHTIPKGDFDCYINCEHCMKEHVGFGFIRDGEFKGIHTYKGL
jgi:hypothetical protein